MKQITNKTILKQGSKFFYPVEIDKVIMWKENLQDNIIIAQSRSIIKDVPVIYLEKYVDTLADREIFKNGKIAPTANAWGQYKGFIIGYRKNPNEYTLADIEKAYALGEQAKFSAYSPDITKKMAIKEIDSITLIEIDNEFNILNYE